MDLRPFAKYGLLWLLSICLVTGCAMPRKAIRPAALIVVDQLEAHERELDAQIAAEDEYYRGLTRVLTEDARREVELEQGNAVVSAIDTYADKVLLESNGVPMSSTTAFL
jgi:hypothetical protein